MSIVKVINLNNKISALLLFLIASIYFVQGQTINLIRFNNAAIYTSGSGVSVIINPTGIFELNNQFILELSDLDGGWTAPVKLNTLEEFYVPVVNGTLPAGLVAGKYKLRVISTSPIDTIETALFTVIDGTNIGVPNFKSSFSNTSNAQFTCLGDCSPASNTFGQLTASATAKTSDILPTSKLNCTICTFSNLNNYEVRLINISTNQITDITTNDGIFAVPNNLKIGTYVFEILATLNGVSSTNSNIFLFHGNGTGLSNSSDENVCVGNTVSWGIDSSLEKGIGRNYMGSKYTIDFGDGSPIETYTHAQLIQMSNITHNFNAISCGKGTSGYFVVLKKLYNKGIYNSGINIDFCKTYNENGLGAEKKVIGIGA